MVSADPVVFNGIHARRGGYLLPPMSVKQVSDLAQGLELKKEELADVKSRLLRQTAHYGVVEGLDPCDLGDAGWGIVFPFAKPGSEAFARQEAIREALSPLIALRKAQAAGKDERRFKEYVGPLAYRPGESKSGFLSRNGSAPGPVDPNRVPYYLMLVADPE